MGPGHPEIANTRRVRAERSRGLTAIYAVMVSIMILILIQFLLLMVALEDFLSGDRPQMLEIVIDPAKLESFGISQQEMFAAISQNNRLIAAGSLDTGHGSFAIKVPGIIENAQDVLNLPIRSTADASVMSLRFRSTSAMR